jgi:hypothetical protein
MLIVLKSRYNTYLKIRRFLRMMDFMKKMDKKATGLFAAGVLFGTAGIKVLSSKDAKKAYTQVTAAALRAKECVMKVATNIQENAEDIYAEAKQINEERAAAEETVDDEASEGTATEESGLGDME